MKFKSIKKIIILIILLLMLFTNVSYCGSATSSSTTDESIMNGSEYIPSDFDFYNPGDYENIISNTNHVGNTGKNFMDRLTDFSDSVLGGILGILQILTFGVAVIMLIYYGIRYVTTSNLPEKGRIKNVVSKNYIVGVVLLFGASGILAIASRLVNNLFGDIG